MIIDRWRIKIKSKYPLVLAYKLKKQLKSCFDFDDKILIYAHGKYIIADKCYYFNSRYYQIRQNESDDDDDFMSEKKNRIPYWIGIWAESGI